MSDLVYNVRVMYKEDVPRVLDLWKETKMNEGAHTLYTWLEVDPNAIQVTVTESGEIIGACSAVMHHGDFAFLGLYVVRKKYRGKGIGYKMWQTCMNRIGSMNACLISTPDKLEIYQDCGGFPLVETEYTVIIYAVEAEAFHPETLSNAVPERVEIQPFQESLLPPILDYDYSLLGYKRNIAVELNCKEKDSLTLVAMKDGSCVGWGTIKLNCYGHTWVAPLYANDADAAEAILRQLIFNFSQGNKFIVRIISSIIEAKTMMDKIGCSLMRECPILYRKHTLKVEVNKVFALFNPNFSLF